MGRKSSTQITKQLAIKIIKKLKAVDITQDGDAHDEYGVYHEGMLIATFGLRRGSRPGSGHDHIPRELGVGPNFAKGLANCPKSRDQYLVEIGETPTQRNDS
ncbi:MAG: hypothetical protein Rhob2KO_14540 [Rhodopirellula baltica]